MESFPSDSLNYFLFVVVNFIMFMGELQITVNEKEKKIVREKFSRMCSLLILSY